MPDEERGTIGQVKPSGWQTAKYDFVKEVRGRGLMIGIVLDHPAGALSALLLEKDLVTLTAGETVLRLLPPLVITREEADAGLNIIEAGLAEYAKTLKDGE